MRSTALERADDAERTSWRTIVDPKVKCLECNAEQNADEWFCPRDGEPLLGGRAVGGEWEIETRLGRGAMGAVYRARHRVDGRLAAIKILGPRVIENSAAEDVQRFLRESQVRVQHPSCVEVHDVGRLPTGNDKRVFWWMRMQYVEGATLEHEPAPLAFDRWLAFGIQICEALEACHQAGVVHRDLKPSNVLVDKKTGRLAITDYGVARFLGHPALSLPNTPIGTPLYMSPEQWAGSDMDARTDLFALGVLLYEWMAGKHPFFPDTSVDPTLAEMKNWTTTQDAFPFTTLDPSCPKAAETLVLRLLRRDPAERPQSAAEVREALLDLSPVQIRLVNHDLDIDVSMPVRRTFTLAEVRAMAQERTDLQWIARRILENPRTHYTWEANGERLSDSDTIASVCAIAKDTRPIEIYLRVHPDVMLQG
ncbi:MAG: serine/threonine protein kinase [Polyangiaceae bacterium]|nr:serine/threonine protein kinase [Polyangiaceae bacterium]